MWLDVFVDAKGQPLAAYQFELSAPRDQITIVGIENGIRKGYNEYTSSEVGSHRLKEHLLEEPANRLRFRTIVTAAPSTSFP